jgi:ATP adenylyltransferase
MEHLWSPWRMTYIENPQNEDGCIFCDRLQEADGPENLILFRRSESFVILNRYPYTNGHMMIVPFVHVPNLVQIEEDTLSEMILLTKDATQVLEDVYKAESYNIGVNIGEAAGAGVTEHVHIHVVPRWAGDTNFMSTTANTRVVPEELEKTYSRLRAAWQNKSP